MALDWIALASLMLQGAGTAAALSRETPGVQQGTLPPSGGEKGVGASPLQSAPTGQPMQAQPINMDPMADVASKLAQYGPPPSAQPEQAAPLPTTKTENKDIYKDGPPNPSEDPLAAQQGADIGRLLASLPEAIALAAPLLGLGPQPQQRPGQILPPAGGPQGAAAFGAPRRPSVGEVLSAIPRLR